MAVHKRTKGKDIYEWKIMKYVFSKSGIITSVFPKCRLTIKEYDIFYDLCEDYYIRNLSKNQIFEKYSQYSKSAITTSLGKLMNCWTMGDKSKRFSCSILDLQDAYLKEKSIPKVHFGSEDDYIKQRTQFILSCNFLKEYAGVQVLLYMYYVYGVSLEALLTSLDDVLRFYKECKGMGYVSTGITIEDFVNNSGLGEGAKKALVESELKEIQKVQSELEDLERKLSLLKDEINSKKAKKRLLYKSVGLNEDDGLYVQESFI